MFVCNEVFLPSQPSGVMSSAVSLSITKTSLFKYTEIFTRRGGSYEYPQSVFLKKKIWKIMYTPVNPVLLYKSGI